MELIIEPSFVTLSAPENVCLELHHLYSFEDESAQFQYARFQKTASRMENTGSWQYKFNTKDEFLQWRADKEKDLKSKLVVFCCQYRRDSDIEDQLIVPIGLLQNVTQYLKARHMPFQIQERRSFDLPKKKLIGFCPTLRPPQITALREALLHPVCMIRMATGIGKTLVGQEIIRHYGLPSIFLVPSIPILEQTVDRFKSAYGSRYVGKYGGGKKKLSHVTVATYASVYHGDADDFLDYDLVVADECHHVPADTYYEVVENRLRNAVYRYGLTADEERLDGGTILVEAATGPVVYSYDAPQAIKDGFLAQPTFIIYRVLKTEGTYINWVTQQVLSKDKSKKIDVRVPHEAEPILRSEAFTGDDNHKAYKNWILGNDLLTKFVCDLAAAFQADKKSVLILIDEKEHGDKLMAYLKPHGAELVTGETEDNSDAQARFNRRELKILVATSTLGEGADTVPVDVLINLMGGRKTKQANGRALRNDPDPDTGVARKPKTIIIDFDVPASPVLHRHFECRVAVHETCGQVHILDPQL